MWRRMNLKFTVKRMLPLPNGVWVTGSQETFRTHLDAFRPELSADPLWSDHIGRMLAMSPIPVHAFWVSAGSLHPSLPNFYPPPPSRPRVSFEPSFTLLPVQSPSFLPNIIFTCSLQPCYILPSSPTSHFLTELCNTSNCWSLFEPSLWPFAFFVCPSHFGTFSR